MYLEFFGLSERPFSITPDIHYLYVGKQHEQALDSLIFGIKERLGIGLLTGEVGSGKTTLARALLARLDNSEVATALLINPLLTVSEMLKAITKDFGIPVRIKSPQRLIAALNGFLLKQAEAGKNALVVVDEAQNLSDEALESLRMLTNLETSKAKLLQILLVGQPELLERLKTHQMRQLNQRIAARCHLSPFSQVEMMRYINHRICTAGGGGKVFFESGAYKMIHKKANGYPRIVNMVCDRSLVSAFVRESYVINKSDVRKAYGDLVGFGGKRSFSPFKFLRRILF